MSSTTWIRALFGIAAVYDGALGVAFLIAPRWLYQRAGVTPPNHWGYVEFPAALLVVFGLMFLAIAARPAANRNLIPVGIGLKVAYCGVVFSHWLSFGLPDLWKPFAFADAVMALLFLWAWLALAPRRG